MGGLVVVEVKDVPVPLQSFNPFPSGDLFYQTRIINSTKSTITKHIITVFRAKPRLGLL